MPKRSFKYIPALPPPDAAALRRLINTLCDRKMATRLRPRIIALPTIIEEAGNRPKKIDEYVSRPLFYTLSNGGSR